VTGVTDIGYRLPIYRNN